MKKVAVEQALSQVKEYLAANGYQVSDLNQQLNQEVDAIVISGQDKDVMGMQDVASKAQVINANGLTPEDIAQSLNK